MKTQTNKRRKEITLYLPRDVDKALTDVSEKLNTTQTNLIIQACVYRILDI